MEKRGKLKVQSNGMILEPFVINEDEWFYASRGFLIVYGRKFDANLGRTITFHVKVPMRKVRMAVDSIFYPPKKAKK